MKYTDRKKIKERILCLICICGLLLTGCGGLPYEMAYDADSRVSSFNVLSRQDRNVAEPYASGLCVVAEDVTDDERVDMSQADAAILLA